MMFVIPENLIASVQMLDVDTGENIEDPDFPAANMIDKHPKKLAKATKNIVKIKTGNIEWLGGFGVINVGCSTITDLKIIDENNNVLFQKDTVTLVVAEDYYSYYHNNFIKKDRYYVLFSGSYSNARIEFILNYPEDTKAYIGLLYGGALYQVGKALWGLSDEIEDLSIIKNTLNGSIIKIDRNILKNIPYKVMARKEEYELFKQLYETHRDFWLFAPIKDIYFRESFLRYGILDKLPSIIEDNQNAIKYQFKVKGAI